MEEEKSSAGSFGELVLLAIWEIEENLVGLELSWQARTAPNQ